MFYYLLLLPAARLVFNPNGRMQAATAVLDLDAFPLCVASKGQHRLTENRYLIR